MNLGHIKLNKVWGILTAARCPCYLGDRSLPGRRFHVSQLLLLVESTKRTEQKNSHLSGKKKKTKKPQILQHFVCISCKWHVTGWVTVYSHFWSTNDCCSGIEELNSCSAGNVNPFQHSTAEGLKKNRIHKFDIRFFSFWHDMNKRENKNNQKYSVSTLLSLIKRQSQT